MKRLIIITLLCILSSSIFAQQWEMPRRFPLQGEKPVLIEISQNVTQLFYQKPKYYSTLKSNCSCIDTLYLVRYSTVFFDVHDYDSAYFISGYTCNERHLVLDPDNPTILTRMKVDYSGHVLWKHVDSMMRGDHFTMYNTSLIKLSDNNYLQMGVINYDYNSPKNWDIRIPIFIKFNSNGDTIWRKMFIDTTNMHNGDWPQDIVAENDGGFTVAALIGSDSKTYSIDTLIDFWYVDSTYVGLIRYDSMGNIVQRKQHFLGGEKVPIQIGLIMKQADGGYIVGGQNRFNGPVNPANYYLLKTDSLFNWQWVKTFSQVMPSKLRMHINPLIDNKYFFTVLRSDTPIVYDQFGQPYYNGYYHLGKLDSDFNILEDTIFMMYLTNPVNTFYFDRGLSVGLSIDNNNEITISSYVGYGANLIHLDSSLNYQWNRWLSYYPYFAEEPYKMRRAHDGGYLIVGRSERPGTGGWLVKTDTNGFALPNGADTLYHIGIEEKNITSKDQLKVYPNPAKEVVYMEIAASCQLPRKGAPSGRAASFELVDMFGKVMLRGEMETGKNLYSISVKELPGGMYVLRIMMDGKMYRQKVVVMR